MHPFAPITAPAQPPGCIDPVDAISMGRPGDAQADMQRFDRPHSDLRGPTSPLWWTIYVSPTRHTAMPPKARDDKLPHVRAQGRSQAADAQQAAMASIARRQRFYPHQWQRSAQAHLDALVAGHQRQLHWIGWERSLPRMYLSPGLLTRGIFDVIQAALEPAGSSSGSTASANRPSARSTLQPISLRVACLGGATQSLVLVIEHPDLTLAPSTMRAINSADRHSCRHDSAAGVTPTSQHERTERAQTIQLTQASAWALSVSGSFTVSPGHSGGTQFRVSLPADDRSTFVRTWLDRVDKCIGTPSRRNRGTLNLSADNRAADNRDAGHGAADLGDASHRDADHRDEGSRRVGNPSVVRCDETRERMTCDVRMFILGSGGAQSVAELNVRDAMLQSWTSDQDAVYRVSWGRWLWLSTATQLPRAVYSDAWRAQLVHCWPIPVDSAARLALTRTISDAMESAIGRRVPPVETLAVETLAVETLADAPLRQIKSPLPNLVSDRLTVPHQRHSLQQPMGTHSAKSARPRSSEQLPAGSVQPPGRSSRWRYPI